MADWIARHRRPVRLAILDGCSGEGGTTRGLVEAGFQVWGADSNPACEAGYMRSGGTGFICRDILEVLEDTRFMRRFDGVVTGPPCQNGSGMTNCRPGHAETYPRLIGPVRERLIPLGLPYIIENVEGNRSELHSPTTLCMFMFGRRGYRHRLFEPSKELTLAAPVHLPDPDRQVVTRVKLNRVCGWPHPVAAAKAGHWEPGKFVSVSGHERKDAVHSVMEIDWMSNREAVKEAVPPYMAKFIGQQLHTQLAA